ncbi:MAG: LacI family transcriptional regulator [Acetobacteraceae bacterium]|nr:LacI family transcriptional regulator [Acetobacteraceae bacterium]
MERKRSVPRPQGDKPGRVGMPKVKLAEVAKAADVTAGTVSRVLNNSIIVSGPLCEKAEEAAQKLGYLADGVARALASRRSRALGAVVPNLSNTNFFAMIEAFQQRLQPHGYTRLRIPKRAFDAVAADNFLARIHGHEFIIPDEFPLELMVREPTAQPCVSRNKDKDK